MHLSNLRQTKHLYWLSGACFVLAIHVAIAAFVWWQPTVQQPSAGAAPQAFVVNMVAAPKTPVSDLPIGPQQQETPPPTRINTPPPSESIKPQPKIAKLSKRKSDISLEQPETAKEKRPPQATKRKPIEQEVPPTLVKTQVVPEQTKDSSSQVQVTQSSAPLAVNAQKVDVAAAPQIGKLNEQHQQQSISWKSQLVNHLEQRKRYPPQAKSRRQQGVPWVRFTIDRQGNVTTATLHRTSGVSSLDREVVALVKRAQPLPIPPEHITDNALTMTLPVAFFIH